MVKLFADTYALVKILKGNPAYEKYSQKELITSEFNIFELAYAMVPGFWENG
jgi:predicted nucleic acid-binding protein